MINPNGIWQLLVTAGFEGTTIIVLLIYFGDA